MASRARKTPSAGSKPDKLMRDALMVALKREAKDANGKPTRKLNLVAEALVEKAIAGDVQAIKEIGDRVDGRPAQAVEHSGALAVNPLADLLEEIDRNNRGQRGPRHLYQDAEGGNDSSALPSNP